MGRVWGGGAVHELLEARGRLVGLAGEQRAGRRPDGVDVRERSRVGSVKYLGSYVAGRANGEADACQARVSRPEGDPEVRQLDAAPLATGGQKLEGEGYFYAPTVLTDIPATAAAAQEELFGPVASVFKAHDLADAIRIANGTSFGLGASAWTRDAVERDTFVAEIEAGLLFINGMVASDPRLPFGGVKNSGFGRELGEFGIREFVNIKSVRVVEEQSEKQSATE